MRERAENRRALLYWERALHVLPHPCQAHHGISVASVERVRELAGDATRECGRGAPGIHGNRQFSDPLRCRHGEVAALRIGRIADQRVCAASVGDDARVHVGIVRRGNHHGSALQIAGLVTTLDKGAACTEHRAQALVEMLCYDKYGKPSVGERFGLSHGRVASADDHGTAAVGPERDKEHTNAQRVPRPGAKNRLRDGPRLMTRSSRGAAAAATIGAVVAALITVPGLWVGTLWDNSETAYGEVAREILLTHDWIVMHLNGVPYFVQPPLYFWLAAAFALVFGPTAFAMRLPSALATIALGAFTGYAVARQAGTRVGVYAAVILSTCLMQAVIGRLAIMDALLDLTVAMTIFWWFRSLETGRGRYAVYGWIAAAAGFLAKGLVAPVVALLVIGTFYLWDRRAEGARAPAWRGWIGGGLLFLALVAPWPLALVAHFKLFPLEKFIGEYTIGRYTGVIENQSGPLWYYLPVVILGFFPWIAFLPMAIVYGVRSLRDAATDPQIARIVRLAFVWMVMPLIFFSFARTKLPNYVALEFPALALVTALYFEAVARKGGTRSAVISAATVPFTIGALAFAIALFTRNNRLTVDNARRAGADRDGSRHFSRARS